MAEFTEGKVYYRVKFPDVGQLYPLVDTFVFIGKNLSDEDKEDTWYFQFADGYARSGSVLTSKGGDRKVVCVTAHDATDILDTSALIAELEMAMRRHPGKNHD